MKVLLIGSTGFIGSHLKPAFEKEGWQVLTPRIEVRNLSEIEKVLTELKPDVLVNASGMTGKPNVDWCEMNQDETMSVNVAGSINLASAAKKHNVYMVQLASGCIYDGYPEGGYTEEDEPNYFGSVYSRSRALSEKALREFPNVLQLRVRIPILGKSHPKNLIDKLIKYPKMINRLNSCTVIEDFIPATIALIKKKQTGVLNMTNIGALDHVQIMTLYKEIVDPNHEYHLMPKAEEDELCKRRSNTLLNTDKREALGIHMSPLEESLRRILTEYKKNKA